MKVFTHISLILISIFWFTNSSTAQVIGGRENGEMTPKAAQASKLSGGSLKGDVNPMTGEFTSSIALGNVSTPGGLAYSLSLNYNSSFSLSASQAMTSGIPYGEGWGPNLPTISVEVDAFHKFVCSDFNYSVGDTSKIYNDTLDKYQGRDEGDLYWFAPMINIPGVASGRAVFKYVDNADDKCLVFALNKFETAIEIRYYGGKGWEIRIANGNTYTFETQLKSFNAPNAQRLLHYSQSSPGYRNQQLDVVNNSDASAVDPYDGHSESIQNVIEPKESFTVWYCNQMFNPNIPKQSINFQYQTYGEFNYFQEFNQEYYEDVRREIFSDDVNTDFTVYTDVHLAQVYSAVDATPVDIIELNYETKKKDMNNNNIVDGTTILDKDDSDVEVKDDLYNYKIVHSWGDSLGDTPFNQTGLGWRRYRHAAVQPFTLTANSVNSTNPYLHSANNPAEYYTDAISTSDEAAFDHGFLESERLFSNGTGYYPGDIYEIKTRVNRSDNQSLHNGNGTLDIAIRSGQNGNFPGNESTAFYPNHDQDISVADFEAQKGLEIFSTFNSPMKWQMGYGQDTLRTSNLFVMPNLPSKYFGFNIQVGPGNSDIDFGTESSANTDMINVDSTVKVREAYPYAWQTGRQIRSTDRIPHNFGTGHPWSMMIPIYNEMALNRSGTNGSAAQPEKLYDAWWATPYSVGLGEVNTPTKFGDNVRLEEVELIRYSKNALMLDSVIVYRVNGEFKGLQDTLKSGWNIMSKKRLDYVVEQEALLRNYDYDNSDVLINEALMRKIILLAKVSDVPVDGDLTQTDFGLADPTQVLTTTLEYGKFLDSSADTMSVYNDLEKIPYIEGMNQYVLTSYTDALGGITRVEYYPFDHASTRLQNLYRYSTSCTYSSAQARVTEAFGRDHSYTVHPAVRFLSKNDEGDGLLSSSNVMTGGSVNPNLKVWEYVYDTTTLMQTPRKLELPTEHFSGHYFQGSEMAFKNVRVYEPYVDSNASGRNYTEYEYYGKVGLNPDIEEYLYYGKPKHIKRYSYNDTLEEETIFNYDYTLAFENGYLRPNFLRENFWNEHPIIQEYEYQDIQEGDTLEVYVVNYIYEFDTLLGQWVLIDSNVMIDESGTAAYPFVDVPNLHGNYTDREMPKLLSLYFFDALDTLNERFMLNSYFVKKTSEIHRTYENLLSKSAVPSSPTIGVTAMAGNNPFGSGHTNPTANDPVKDDPLIAFIDPNDEQTMIDELVGASPISDAVLNVLVESSVSGDSKFTILDEQGNLSNAIWGDIWANMSTMSSNDIKLLAEGQSYISDQVILDMFDVIDRRSSEPMVEAVALKNSYLSGQVINDMITPDVTMPGSAFADIMAQQPQLPESDLINIIDCSKANSANINTVLSNQFLTDSIYHELLVQTKYSTESITKVIETNNNFPTDQTLIDIIEHSPQFSQNQLTRIFAEADRAIGNEVQYSLIQQVGPAIADAIVGEASFDNSLSQYCWNDTQTGRTFIETKTEYEYYEADQNGKAVGKAYEILLGMRENADAQSRLPFTVNPADHGLSGSSINVDTLELKHEPSWMLFSVTTSSPHLDGAYNREEYFYNYDLRNRYDRHWYNYDFDNNIANYNPIKDTVGEHIRILVANDIWDTYYASGAYGVPQVPDFDAMSRTQELGNRSQAFQKTNISKNTRDNDPKYASEYYFYEKGWVVPGYPGAAQSVEFTADTCTSPPQSNDPCDTYTDCNDCYSVFYKPYMEWEEIVPLGYCSWFVGSLGYIVCPSDHDPTGDFPNDSVAQLHCGNYPTTTSSLPYGETFDDMVQLRSVYVQVDDEDHSTTQEFANKRLDSSNTYIAEFLMGNPNGQTVDHYMILPSDHLKVREIKERNRFTQVALEENAVGLQTKYHYNPTTYIWNYDVSCPILNYTSRLNEDIGLPTKVEVGFGLSNVLVSEFEYNPIGLVNKTTDPNGKTMEYEFDTYYRLTKITEDSTRLLTEMEYHTWDLDSLSSFDDRTDSNFVLTKNYSDSITSRYEMTKAFMDPLGRNQGNVLAYSEDGLNHKAIHSGFVGYDNLGRVIETEKTYTSSYLATTVGEPALPKSSEFGGVVEKVLFEGGYKGRPERSSNFGVDIDSNEVIRTNYDITSNIFASCELDLNLNELYLVMRPGGTANVRLFRTEVYDQDNKRSVNYKNAFGQDVATLRYNDNNEKIVTVFAYDSYGNLTKVVNPEKQETDYIYNRLGQLVIENTVDAGAKHFMYNKQGLVSIILDDQGRNHKTGYTPDPFYRVMEYDIFGRMTKQGRSDISNEAHSFYLYNDSTLYGPLHYKNDSLPITLDDTLLVDRYFLYKFSDAQTQDYLYNFDYHNGSATAGLITGEMDVDFREKTITYGGQQGTYELGRIIQTLSFNENDQNIQSNSFDYDVFGNISKQTVSFNAAGGVLGAPPAITSVIEYPEYNYRGALMEEVIDVDDDGVTDFHCYMQYDPLNRLTAIYGAAGGVDSLQDATLLVSYEYDDVTGKMSKREHSVNDILNDVLAVANAISYEYDQRDRLTRIKSGLSQYGLNDMFDYRMFYDDQAVDFSYGQFASSVTHDNNWNGNVNGIEAVYDFSGSYIMNNVDGFDGPTVYGYDYDAINRLIGADGTVGDLLDTAHLNDSYLIGDVDLTYDRIGNILTLQRTLRNTDQSQGAPYTMMQDFTYSYATDQNRLLSAVGNNAETDTRTYTYDVIGNVLTDDYRNIVGTEYGRGAYAHELTIDPDGIAGNSDDEAISYLYSSSDLRIYKKHVTSTDTLEDYYLMDASGRTVAILKTGYTNDGWEYYAYGSEREVRIKPTTAQTPGSNGSATLDDKQIGKDNATFYVYDHLGNTRITYTPVGFDSQSGDTTIYETDFTTDTTGWTTNGSSTSFGNGTMAVVTDTVSLAQYVKYNLGSLTSGETYSLSFYADLGTSPGIDVSVTGGTMSSSTVQQGMNYLQFTYNGFFQADLQFAITGGAGTKPSYTFSIDDIFVGQIPGDYTSNRIEHVADYFPYGKMLREFVDSDEEKYLTTQHERDRETGLDYRGARYYDADIARFLSTDPWQAKYPHWSTYNYVMGNPIVFIDPTGKGVEDIGIYTLSESGSVKHIKTVESDDNYDMLYLESDWSSKEYYGNRLRVDDQELLSQIASKQYGATSAKDEAFKLFWFAAHNTYATEWGLAGFKNGDEPTQYAVIQGSEYGVHAFPWAEKEYGLTNKIFDLHSHPLPSGINRYENSFQASDGDYDRYQKHSKKYKAAGKSVPNHYMIFAQTDILSRYYSKGDGGPNYRIEMGKVNSYQELMKQIK